MINESLDVRVGLKNLVAQQLPEFIRAEYPTFVAFVEAYYEYLDNQGVNLKQVRDIDETLEDYIKFFKAELAHNYPVVSSDYKTERFLLKHIKDQYLAKGSEASYKLLFRLLYGKDVFIDYPGRQMLRVSDGRWTQDVSLFVKVLTGDPEKLLGKTATIQTSRRIYNTSVVKGVDAASAITATVEKVLATSVPDVYEIFLDRNFYGDIFPGNSIKYGSEFQAVILPCTAKIKISQAGRGFRPGMVFQLRTGEGTPFWFKVSTVDSNGGLKTIDTIKFGLQYNTDFSVTVLPSSALSSKKKTTQAVSNLSFRINGGLVRSMNIVNPGSGYTLPPIVSIDGDGDGAVAHAVIQNGEVVDIVVDEMGSLYTFVLVNITAAPGDVTGGGALAEAVIGSDYDYSFSETTDGFTESGYINRGDYWDYAFSDGTYVGTIARQFFINAADTIGTGSALLNVSLEAVAKYPGYYRTNDGFLDDSMFIQDSYYYQSFAYVLKIDEQLESYASIIRSMLHPAGMALFGEYSINNKVNLSVALDSLVKSLGVTLYDLVEVTDEYEVDENGVVVRGNYFAFYKDLSTEYSAISDFISSISVIKKADEDFATITEPLFTKVFGKRIGFTGQAETVFALGTDVKKTFTKPIEDTTELTENFTRRFFTKSSEDLQPILDVHAIDYTLNTIIDTLPGVYPEFGFIIINPYDEGSYQAEQYSNERDSTFST
jgi:hypothetical protein